MLIFGCFFFRVALCLDDIFPGGYFPGWVLLSGLIPRPSQKHTYPYTRTWLKMLPLWSSNIFFRRCTTLNLWNTTYLMKFLLIESKYFFFYKMKHRFYPGPSTSDLAIITFFQILGTWATAGYWFSTIRMRNVPLFSRYYDETFERVFTFHCLVSLSFYMNLDS